MTNPLQFPTRCRALAILLLVSLIPCVTGHAQTPAQAYDNAAAVYESGDFGAAADAFAQFITDYPTSPQVFPARLQLAYSLYFTGEYDEAEKSLQQLLGTPPPPEDLKVSALSFLPQILSAKASEAPEGSAERRTGFQEAVKKFTEFIEAYPRSEDVERAVFGRALAKFQLGEYDEAISDLEKNLQAFPNSPSILESQNLLALVLATKAGKLFSEGNDPEALTTLDRSADLQRDIIQKNVDLALSNTANFQLGEILLNKAGRTGGADKQQALEQAREAFRNVQPKENLVTEQERRIEDYKRQIREALQRRDTAAVDRLEKERERQVRKLGELKGREDQVPTAHLKVAEVYFAGEDNNTARTVIDFVTPFLTKETDQKRAAYFKALTYALQNQDESAVSAYNTFQSQYKGDELASNLPVSLGKMFVDLGRPSDAIQYLTESVQIYPDGPFAGLSAVLKATAQSQLGENEEAITTYKEYLAKPNIEPATGVVAQKGLGDIYKNLQRWDEAIEAYEKVVSTYPQFEEEVIDSTFWIAYATQQKGENEKALTLLNDWIASNANHGLMPIALYALSSAQLGENDKAGAIETLDKLAEEHPDSQPASFSYFIRAQLYASDAEPEQVKLLMEEFIEKYPEDDKIWFAYDSLGQAATNTGTPDEAAELYEQFAEKYPQNERAPEALLKAANAQRSLALQMARNVAALPKDEQEQWEDYMRKSIADLEKITKDYPSSNEVAPALQGILESMRLLLAGELIDYEGIITYFEEAAENASTPNVRSQSLFTLAGFISEQDQEEALAVMDRAFDPSVRYAADNLDTYGIALVEADRLDDAEQVFRKVAQDYPNPDGTEPTQAPLEIQQAQAVSIFGLGRVAQEREETAAAATLFEQLKTLYPWSPKVLEANFGIAQGLAAEGKFEEALDLANQITRQSTATAELRAKSLFLGGEIFEKQNDKATAADYYIKVFQYYPGVPQIAADALWRGGQLLEQIASGNPDPASKARQIRNARRAYQDILNEYSNSPYAEKAKERLAALPTEQNP